MKEGLLWFDNDPNRKLVDKVSQAAARYQVRLHQKPTVCYLSPDEFDGQIEEINGIYLKPAPYIRPHYLWIGVEQETIGARAA